MPSVVVRQTVNHLLETAYLKGAIDRTWPSQVYIDITSRCNCRCVMCHVWKSEPADELSTQAWVDVLRDIARWPGPGTKVNISGGEPLLRADLPELLGEAARLGLAVGFVTNGSLITEELAATIVDSGVFNVNVSLDSLDPAIHDRLRGVAGTTAKALAAFEHLAAAAARRPDRPVALVVKTTIMEPTLDGLLDMVEFAAAEGLSGVLFQPLSPTFRGEQRERWYDDDPLWVRDPRKAAAVIDELVIGKECGLPILNSVDHLRTIATYLADPERGLRHLPCGQLEPLDLGRRRRTVAVQAARADRPGQRHDRLAARPLDRRARPEACERRSSPARTTARSPASAAARSSRRLSSTCSCGSSRALRGPRRSECHRWVASAVTASDWCTASKRRHNGAPK